MPTSHENVSPDLIWACVNGRGSYLHKSKMSGGTYFSRDSYNLLNIHSRKQEGYVNPAAISIQRPEGDANGIVLKTKKPSVAPTKPASSVVTTTYGPNTSGRKVYRSIVAQTAKRGYRPDLRAEAVARASKIKLSQKAKKDEPLPKVRGAKKRRADAGVD